MEEYQFKFNIITGGLVGLAINSEEKYLLVVTHSGRGVYDLNSGDRIARDYEVIYPNNSKIDGIPPFSQKSIQLNEYDFENDLVFHSPSGKLKITGESDNITVEVKTG